MFFSAFRRSKGSFLQSWKSASIMCQTISSIWVIFFVYFCPRMSRHKSNADCFILTHTRIIQIHKCVSSFSSLYFYLPWIISLKGVVKIKLFSVFIFSSSTTPSYMLAAAFLQKMHEMQCSQLVQLDTPGLKICRSSNNFNTSTQEWALCWVDTRPDELTPAEAHVSYGLTGVWLWMMLYRFSNLQCWLTV